MKTAVSIPDHIYLAADRFARDRGLTRSRLYAQALADFLTRDQGDEITQKLNEIYGRVQAELPPDLVEMQALSIDREAW